MSAPMGSRAAAFLLAAIVALPAGARADVVDDLRREVAEVEDQARSLSVRYRTQAASTEQIAEHRLVDAQVLYNLKDYTRAAIILLDYVSKYKQTPGYAEAVFFLADSLYHKRDFLSARTYFRTIVDEIRGPYYQEALQRLIELSLYTGDSSDVERYLAALAEIPRDQLKPSVPYVRGKYFYFKGRSDEAIASFREIAPGKRYYMHAQYFIGVALVRRKDYAGAVKVFQALLKTQPRSQGEKHVRDLTYLALGRLFYHQNKVAQAIDIYQRVSRRSREFDTQLYESAWAYVKAGEYTKALRALDLLVLARPKSPIVPEVLVLQGNLLIRLKKWGRATDIFSKTREKFAPLHKRMEEILAARRDPKAFFDALLSRSLGDLSVAIEVPEVALHWARKQPKVRRAMLVAQDMDDIEKSLTEVKRLLKRLDRAINSPARIRIFPEFATAKARALEVENRLAVVRRKILANERALVMPVATGTEREKLRWLASRRVALAKDLAKLPLSVRAYKRRASGTLARLAALDRKVAELATLVQSLQAQLIAAEKYFRDTAGAADEAVRRSFEKEAGEVRDMVRGLKAEIEEIRGDLQDARDSAGVGSAEEVAERGVRASFNQVLDEEHALLLKLRGRLDAAGRARFDAFAGLLTRCGGVATVVGEFDRKLDEGVERKLAAVRAVVADEKRRLGDYTVQAADYGGQTDRVAGAIAVGGFRNVAKRFYEIVVRSDVGIIDVAWALKDAKTKAVSQLVNQQKQDLKLLDQEFKELLKEDQ